MLPLISLPYICCCGDGYLYLTWATFSTPLKVIGKGYRLYFHLRYTELAVSTAAPPACCLRRVFAKVRKRREKKGCFKEKYAPEGKGARTAGFTQKMNGDAAPRPRTK